MRFTAALCWRWPKGEAIEALRFGAAVAGIKCTRIGGSAGAPTRAEVEAFLADKAASGQICSGSRIALTCRSGQAAPTLI